MIDHSPRSGGGVLTTAVMAVALLLMGCGRQVDPDLTPSVVPSTTVGGPAAEPATTQVRGAPRWETVVTLTGTGSAEPPSFPILADSIQWRARWRCEVAQLRITTDPAPRRPVPLVDGACPGTGEGFAIVTGAVRLTIVASGPWEVIVDQQVDTPLAEPPFEGMATATVVGQGPFHPIEKDAKGDARLYRRTDGSVVLRLEGLEVTNNVDLFVWLSEAADPRTSAEVLGQPYVSLGNLKSTVGDQSYVVPAAVPLERLRSLVIWCEPVRIAYGAAPLT